MSPARPIAKTSDRSDIVRKLGERRETITVELTPEEIQTEKTNVVDLHGRKQNLEAARKSLMSEYKAKIEIVEAAMDTSARAATTGKKALELDIEEYLTRSREVVRVRADTGDIIGRRTARTEELQEALAFEDRSSELAFPSPDDAFGGR